MCKMKTSLLNSLDDNIAFYESLRFSEPGGIDNIVFPGSIACVVFSAIENRLRTMRFAVENAFVSDAYVLIRMVYEDILTLVYLDVKKGDNLEDDDIKRWIQGQEKLHSLRMPELLKFLADNLPVIRECFDLLEVPVKYRDIKDSCNDFVHNNSLATLLLNTGGSYVEAKESHYCRLKSYLEALRNLVFASLCILRPSHISSSDYVGHLDIGLTPPEGSQYWVAPYAQKEFDKLKKTHEGLAELIDRVSFMQFDAAENKSTSA